MFPLIVFYFPICYIFLRPAVILCKVYSLYLHTNPPLTFVCACLDGPTQLFIHDFYS